MYRTILLPTDGSELSGQAAQAAVQLAKAIGAQLTALHVTAGFSASEFSAHAALEHARQHEEASNKDARRALGAVERLARDAGVAFAGEHRIGDSPWRVIVRVAQELGSDMIFMASHGRHGIDALLLGSETNKVLTHSSIPVLVWR